MRRKLREQIERDTNRARGMPLNEWLRSMQGTRTGTYTFNGVKYTEEAAAR